MNDLDVRGSQRLANYRRALAQLSLSAMRGDVSVRILGMNAQRALGEG